MNINEVKQILTKYNVSVKKQFGRVKGVKVKFVAKDKKIK